MDNSEQQQLPNCVIRPMELCVSFLQHHDPQGVVSNGIVVFDVVGSAGRRRRSSSGRRSRKEKNGVDNNGGD